MTFHFKTQYPFSSFKRTPCSLPFTSSNAIWILVSRIILYVCLLPANKFQFRATNSFILQIKIDWGIFTASGAAPFHGNIHFTPGVGGKKQIHENLLSECLLTFPHGWKRWKLIDNFQCLERSYSGLVISLNNNHIKRLIQICKHVGKVINAIYLIPNNQLPIQTFNKWLQLVHFPHTHTNTSTATSNPLIFLQSVIFHSTSVYNHL